MELNIDAIYEAGTLRLDRPLPLADGEKVRVTIRTKESHARRSYGIMGFTGSAELADQIAMDPEYGILESP